MRKTKPRRSKTYKTLFDPDALSAEIHRSLKRDLRSFLHEYRGVCCATPVAIDRQINGFFKKYVSPLTDTSPLQTECFRNFAEVNSRMLDTNLALLMSLPDIDQRVQTATPFMDKVHLRARALVRFVLGDCDEDAWFLECKHSSGATIGVPFVDTSIEKKSILPLTSTSGAERVWCRYLEYDRQLYSSLVTYNGGRDPSHSIDIQTGSRATTVDKTSDKRRMICVEPTVNMFLQQGLMQVMYKRLSDVGIDLESLQVWHKRLAWEASITGSLATIDFSSASDSVSIELLRWLLPPSWFDSLWSVRSHHCLLGDVWVPLQMMSTMGNATTFPLETLVFWAYGHAVKLSLSRGNSLFPEWEDLKSISVFGDDCIIPSAVAEQFCSVLQSIGFQVNFEKSFLGPIRFRESCGGDYLAGRDVRPYFLKGPMSTKKSYLEPWLYVITNSLLKKYIRYFGELSYIYDKSLWTTIFSVFERHDLSIKFVPPDFPDDSGLKWFFDHERLSRLYRFRSEPIYEDEHGTRTFKYLRFRYLNRYKPSYLLRYHAWLKSRAPRSGYTSLDEVRGGLSFDRLGDSLELFNPKRKIGGYVVATGVSGHWSE